MFYLLVCPRNAMSVIGISTISKQPKRANATSAAEPHIINDAAKKSNTPPMQQKHTLIDNSNGNLTNTPHSPPYLITDTKRANIAIITRINATGKSHLRQLFSI